MREFVITTTFYDKTYTQMNCRSKTGFLWLNLAIQGCGGLFMNVDWNIYQWFSIMMRISFIGFPISKLLILLRCKDIY